MELRLPEEYPFAEHQDARLRWLHGFLIRLRPGPHRRAYMKPALHRSSEGCAACHRTSYNLPQNDYKLLRTADDYGTWQAGPDSGESVHGFQPPGPVRRCQDCHDPHGGGVQLLGRSSVQAVGTGVPARPDEPPVTVDLFALRRSARSKSASEELVAPLERSAPRLQPGRDGDTGRGGQEPGRRSPVPGGNRRLEGGLAGIPGQRCRWPNSCSTAGPGSARLRLRQRGRSLVITPMAWSRSIAKAGGWDGATSGTW